MALMGQARVSVSGGGGSPVSEPSAFVAGNWSLAPGPADTQQLTATLSALPDDGGLGITSVEYEINASGTWNALPGFSGLGTYYIPTASPDTSYNVRLRAVNGIGPSLASDTKAATSSGAPAATPSAFVVGNWTLAQGSNANELTLTLLALPADGGAAISDVEYRVDGGSWVSLGNTALQAYTLTMAAPDTSYAIEIRAENSVGFSAASDTKNATSGEVPASAPAAFTAPMWDVSQGSAPNELDVTIISLPANNGSSITSVEYRVNGAGSWTNLGITSGSTTITMAEASTLYGIELRAVNSAGAGPAGNSESATSGIIPVPATPVNANWALAQGSGANQIDLTLNSLPADNGSAITAIEYTIDSGSNWTALAGIALQTYTLTMAAPETSYTFAIRAVNAGGASGASATRTATSGVSSSSISENEVVFTGGADGEMINLVSASSGVIDRDANGPMTLAAKFRIKQLAESTPVFRHANAAYIYVNTSGNIQTRIQAPGNGDVVNRTEITGYADESVHAVVFSTDGDSADLWLDGVQAYALRGVGKSAFTFKHPFAVNGTWTTASNGAPKDVNFFQIWVANGYIDLSTHGASFWGTDLVPTQALFDGNAINGVSPVVAESGTAVDWNAISGSTGTITDA